MHIKWISMEEALELYPPKPDISQEADMETIKLAPCPFCRSKAILEKEEDHHGVSYSLGCIKPECIGHNAYYCVPSEEISIELAIGNWNKRSCLEGPFTDDLNSSKIVDTPTPKESADMLVKKRIERFGNEIFRCIDEAEQQNMTFAEVIGVLEMAKADLIMRANER